MFRLDMGNAGNKELTLTKSCRLAHSKLQDHVLRDALKLGASAARAQWGKTTVKVFLLKVNGGLTGSSPVDSSLHSGLSQFDPDRNNVYLHNIPILQKRFSQQCAGIFWPFNQALPQLRASLSQTCKGLLLLFILRRIHNLNQHFFSTLLDIKD
eukprot:g28739.t1